MAMQNEGISSDLLPVSSGLKILSECEFVIKPDTLEKGF